MNTPLTQEESAFAADHHNLVYSFLNRKHYPESEYYDIVIFGYLCAVRRYLAREDLREAFKFSTIAYGAMRSAMSHHFRAKNHSMRWADARRYDEDSDNSNRDDSVWESVSRDYDVQTVREKLSETITPEQSKVVYLKAIGYNNREIGERYGMTAKRVGREYRAASDAIRNNAANLLDLFAA